MPTISLRRLRRTLWLCLGLLAGSAVLVSAQDGPTRFPVEQDGAWGYIDRAGTIAIEPQFDAAAPFSDGRARVEQGGTTAFIDTSGAVVFTTDAAQVESFAEGRAAFQPEEDGPFGYIDRSGAVVIEPQFRRARPFAEGRAAVQLGAEDDDRYGYIDRGGARVFASTFDEARSFGNGRAPIRTGGSWSYIDRNGKKAFSAKLEDARPFSEGLAAIAVEEDGFFEEWGYIDTTGQVAIEPNGDWDRAGRFSNGRAVIEGPFSWFYIDTTGQKAFEAEFDDAEPFAGGRARVVPERGDDAAYIDTEGTRVWPPPEPMFPDDGPSATGIEPESLAVALPAQLSDGFRRTDLQSGVREGQAGARAVYEGGGGTVDVRIGTLDAEGRELLTEMLTYQADREEDVQPITERGHSGYQGPMQGRRQVVLFVGPQILVQVATDGDLPWARLRAILAALDVRQWEDLSTGNTD